MKLATPCVILVVICFKTDSVLTSFCCSLQCKRLERFFSSCSSGPPFGTVDGKMWRLLSTCSRSLLFVSTLLLVTHGQPGIDAASRDSQAILEIRQYTSAVQRAVDFFGRHSKAVTLDGVFALRISQGHFNVLRSAFHKSSKDSARIPSDLMQSLLDIASQIDSIISDGIKASKHLQQPLLVKYFQTLGFVIETVVPTWPLEYVPNMPLSTPVSERVHTGVFSEKKSDRCMSEILGTGPRHTQCSLNSECRDFMLEPYGARSRGYTLTHQLLFAQLCVMRGCNDTYERALRLVGTKHGGDARKVSTIRKLFGVGCANIFLEMIKAMAGDAPKLGATLKDVFLEQGSLCAMYGYPAVLPDEWLSKVLPWQSGIGCLDDGRGIALGAEEDQRSRSGRDVSSENRQDAAETPAREGTDYGTSRSRAPSRRLLYDARMRDGCSQHSTGLFISYLVAKIRYQTELVLGLHSMDLSDPELMISHHGRKTVAGEVQSLISHGAAHAHSAAKYLLENLKSLQEYLTM